MKQNNNIRLCGGTFFTLLLEARKPRYGVREHYMGDKDGLSEPEALIGLAKIIVPDFQEPLQSMMKTIKGNTFDYKSCKNKGGTYFPFSNKTALSTFNQRVTENYVEALNAMIKFCDDFLHMKDSTKKDETLIKALVELIDEDDSILPEQIFYIKEDGTGISKAGLVATSSICFQSFLLGVFHFAVMRKEAASIGKETYDSWCPSKGGAPRVYEGTMGENLKNDLKLIYAKIIVEEHEEPQSVEIIGLDQEQTYEKQKSDTNDQDTKVVPQMNFTFNVTGNNNSFYNHVDTVNNYYGGKKDGK